MPNMSLEQTVKDLKKQFAQGLEKLETFEKPLNKHQRITLTEMTKTAEALCQLRPRESDVYFALGWIHIQRGNLPGAYQNLCTAINIEPSETKYSEELVDAIKGGEDKDRYLQDCLKYSQFFLNLGIFNPVQNQYAQELLDEALKEVNILQKEEKLNTNLLLGKLYLRNANLENCIKAVSCYKEAVEFNNDKKNWYKLGIAQMILGKYIAEGNQENQLIKGNPLKDAKSCLESAGRDLYGVAEASSGNDFYWLGKAYQLMGQKKEAKCYFYQALTLETIQAMNRKRNGIDEKELYTESFHRVARELGLKKREEFQN